MKLRNLLLSALAGVSTASTELHDSEAKAYIVRQSDVDAATASDVPSIPSTLAESILLPRINSADQSSILNRLPSSLADDEAISFINQFGVPPKPLFGASNTKELPQGFITFSGVTDKYRDEVDAVLPDRQPSFTSPGLSSSKLALIKNDQMSCHYDPPKQSVVESCIDQSTGSFFIHYDLSKDNGAAYKIASFDNEVRRARDGQIELTVLVLPPITTSSSGTEELRRRTAEEQVMGEPSDLASLVASISSPQAQVDTSFNGYSDNEAAAPKYDSNAKTTVVPSCFTSQNACMTATNNCYNHGECVDRWTDSEASCFSCRCEMTKEEDDKGRTHLYRWGGSMCQKRDISTPFWLFAGVSIGLVSTIAFSISLLFSVGEEKLPGVIGAGVSRSK
ncbi:hypothetical protein F4780DRAFT_353805 [Xylariomycetidae sp. FL0641]|nr:hypothetical protein F4780DRAFT_353805 [Xylariomycetidae sp. FL0641]